jgi:hypothetical protein
VALFSGETIELTNVVLDFDGVTPVTDISLGDGTMTVSIIDSAVPPNTWVSAEEMTYDSVRALWSWLWITNGSTPVPAGTYDAKVTMLGDDGTESFAFQKLRLKAPSF